MIKITTEQWELYLKKYKNLMWRISHMISGDTMLASIEDNFSDLCIAAIESINGFHKKTGVSIDEMFGMKLFDQYTKTCLWTAKARKGIRLSERMPFRNKHLSIDELRTGTSGEGTSFDIADTSSTARYARVEADDCYNSYDPKVKKLINLLESNSEFMTETGDLKLKPIAEAMNITTTKLAKLIRIMEVKNDPNR